MSVEAEILMMSKAQNRLCHKDWRKSSPRDGMPEAIGPVRRRRMLSTKSELADASLTRTWPADRLDRWPIERLIPYASNARLHSEADIDKIDDAIGNWGWPRPE